MNVASKLNNNPESYSPNEVPEIIIAVEKRQDDKYEVYKSIELRMNYVELSESLKLAGVPYSRYPNFENIGVFHDEYKQKMMDRYAPYTEVGYSGTFNNNVESWDYIFGCQIRKEEDIPDGLICIDTGVKRFAEITFRANSAYELVGGETGPGEGMQIAGEYIKEVWLPKHMDEVNITDINNICFQTKLGDNTYYCGMIEIYKVELDDDPEMCFYIPLK